MMIIDKLQVGIDVGGTFTDLVAYKEETGQTLLVKVPSTPQDPSEGAYHAIKKLLHSHPADITSIVHASTVGSNLFLGQLGLDIPKGALVTTTGFRDVLEIGRQKRPELYNPFFERPKPLIDQHVRFTVNERVNFQGEVLKAIDEKEIKSIAHQLKEENVQTVAVVFLHSYANATNERRVKEILSRELPKTVIVVSCEVDPAYREYERMSTTVVNSLLIPIVSRYLERIRNRLINLEIKAPLYIMQSNGGLASVETATRLPVATIESGPATGVTAAAYWSRLLGVPDILSFDMGGTTAKAGTVIGGVPQMVGEAEVGGLVHGGRSVKGSGYPVRYPFVDLAEISGGGGTIAWLDQGKALMVGPVSAGADPGPACYGKGGTDPTVTDANLVLGRLNPAGLSGGEVDVFPDLAERVINVNIAWSLGISMVEAASGILEIVNNHMMRALRLVSIERGYDPRDFAMLAFGGCGPMHAAFLAEALGTGVIFIPPESGVFSALGLILADFRHDYLRSVMKESSQIDAESLSEAFTDMEKEASETMRREGFAPDSILMERQLGLRYLEQSYELTVPYQGSLEEAVLLFHQRHNEVYGYSSDDEPTEVVSAHLVAHGLKSKPKFAKKHFADPYPSLHSIVDERPVYFEPYGWMDSMVYAREHLLPGNRIDGPAIVQQYDSTCVIPPGWKASVDEFSNLRLRIE
ncbi:hydantoinase/oxoprolinase family protein [Chloroflexota bacterium]